MKHYKATQVLVDFLEITARVTFAFIAWAIELIPIAILAILIIELRRR